MSNWVWPCWMHLFEYQPWCAGTRPARPPPSGDPGKSSDQQEDPPMATLPDLPLIYWKPSCKATGRSPEKLHIHLHETDFIKVIGFKTKRNLLESRRDSSSESWQVFKFSLLSPDPHPLHLPSTVEEGLSGNSEELRKLKNLWYLLHLTLSEKTCNAATILWSIWRRGALYMLT